MDNIRMLNNSAKCFFAWLGDRPTAKFQNTPTATPLNPKMRLLRIPRYLIHVKAFYCQGYSAYLMYMPLLPFLRVQLSVIETLKYVKYVEINLVRIEILNWLLYKSDCLKNKLRERQAYIYGKEEGILGKAEYQIQRPIPSIAPGARPLPRHGGCKPPATCPQP
jgi:hypothetical protein